MKIYLVLDSGKVQGIYSTFEKAKDSCRVWVAVNAVVNFTSPLLINLIINFEQIFKIS